jgi:hypothetical protein
MINNELKLMKKYQKVFYTYLIDKLGSGTLQANRTARLHIFMESCVWNKRGVTQ